MIGIRRIGGTPTGPGAFAVRSATSPEHEWVVEWRDSSALWCGCPGFTRRARCRHVLAVFDRIAGEWRERRANEKQERVPR